ncbi:MULTISPECIES: hypothetical protein [Rhizobium]|nr:MULTISPECIES: hypothetical protein [Rhizobium]
MITADATALVDRQIVVRQIVGELQAICDKEAESSAVDQYPALNHLLQAI